ncbi:hypothetical protein [Phascolarctobacterium sp.]
MQMNPLTLMQMFQQLRSNPNPMAAMQSMMGNNPLFQRAMEMAKGKSPEQLQDTVKNLCQQRGIDFEQAKQQLKQFGINL